LAIVLSVLLRYTDSDFPFGIFKLFLAPLCFIEVSVSSQGSKRSRMVFLGVSILPLSTAFVIAFGNVPTMWYCFSFHFNDTVESGHILLSMKSLNIRMG
jgi:hypothetical protein